MRSGENIGELAKELGVTRRWLGRRSDTDSGLEKDMAYEFVYYSHQP